MTITWAPWVFDGASHPATGSVAVSRLAGEPRHADVVYYSGSVASGTPLAGAPSTVGTYTVLASFAGNGNYEPASATKTILVSYAWERLPPADQRHRASDGAGGEQVQARPDGSGEVRDQERGRYGRPAVGNPTFSRSGNLGSCDATAALDTITEVVTPDAGVVYSWDGSQYHYNWSTKGLTAGEYRVYANLGDGTKKYVDICLTK